LKRRLKVVSCVLLVLFTVTVLVGNPIIGPYGADVVSAATDATTGATTSSNTTTTKTTTTAGAARILRLGSKGEAVRLLQGMLNNFGYNLKVDGVFGPKTLAAVKSFQSKNGLKADGVVGLKTYEKLNPQEDTLTDIEKLDSIRIGKVEYAAHGTKCFTVAVVAVAGDVIVDALVDDYQFISTDVAIGVPNSDKDFATNYADPKIALASKRLNTEYYSNNMKTKGGSTIAIDKNLDAIQAYVKGKTITELEATLSSKTKEQMVDVVSSATLVDTDGYVAAIVAAAKAAKENSPISVDAATLNSLKLKKTEYAAHGTKCFTLAVVAVSDDKVIGALLDDYQFISTDVAVGVPNSDKDFAANYADPKIALASKRLNTEYYSNNMKTKGGSTIAIDKNLDAIQAYVSGKTISELEAILSNNTKEQMVDVVSSATLVDTDGYVAAIIAAAKSVK